MLLRDSILDGMREVLLTRDWSAITLSHVAKAAGISRQTIYNEFGSRQGLAQAYALRLADRLVDQIDDAIVSNDGDVHAAFVAGVPRLLRRVGRRPPGDLAADRRFQTRPASADHHRQRADHHALLAAADLDIHATAG